MQTTYEMNDIEIEEVSGGFACLGACILAASIAAGALFGAGIAVGKNL